jgi:ABC-type uncharacterized transport system permease subunit
MAKIKLIRREKESPLARVLVPVASVLMAFAVGWIILALAGHNPVLVYQKLYNGALGSPLKEPRWAFPVDFPPSLPAV